MNLNELPTTFQGLVKEFVFGPDPMKDVTYHVTSPIDRHVEEYFDTVEECLTWAEDQYQAWAHTYQIGDFV